MRTASPSRNETWADALSPSIHTKPATSKNVEASNTINGTAFSPFSSTTLVRPTVAAATNAAPTIQVRVNPAVAVWSAFIATTGSTRAARRAGSSAVTTTAPTPNKKLPTTTGGRTAGAGACTWRPAANSFTRPIEI